MLLLRHVVERSHRPLPPRPCLLIVNRRQHDVIPQWNFNMQVVPSSPLLFVKNFQAPKFDPKAVLDDFFLKMILTMSRKICLQGKHSIYWVYLGNSQNRKMVIKIKGFKKLCCYKHLSIINDALLTSYCTTRYK